MRMLAFCGGVLCFLFAFAVLRPSPALAGKKDCGHGVDANAMYSSEHLAELVRSVSRIRAAAVERVSQGKKSATPDGEIVPELSFTSKAGVYVVYTVDTFKEKDGSVRYLHYISFSAKGCYLATPFARTLLAYLHDTLGFERFSVGMKRSSRGVTHLFAILTEAEHQELASLSPLPPTPKQLEDMTVKCIVGGGKLKLTDEPSQFPPQKMCVFRK